MKRHAVPFLFLFPFSFLSLLFLSTGCATEPTDNQVAMGEWGGTNIDLRVAAASASMQFKCGALGEIAGPIPLSGANQFDVAGTYDPVLVLGGPRTARFTGSVKGTNMTLILEVEGQQVGTYQLQFGIPGSFEPCNF
jgi:hypothetical protein